MMPRCSSVPTMARNMPISPAHTPRRAVAGELSHFNERMKSAVAIRYVNSITCSVAIMWSRLPRAAGLKHFQHAIGDQKAADDIAGCGDDGDGAKDGGEPALAFANQNDRAHDRDRVQCVGQRHQRRVQQRRNPANHFESDESCQHEDVKAGQEIHFHQAAPPAGVVCNAGSAKNSRTRVFTISPLCVSNVSRMISSFRLSCSVPSLASSCRNALTLRAYIWLA